MQKLMKHCYVKLWPARRDSNPRSSEPESDAISSFATSGKLQIRTKSKKTRSDFLLVGDGGFEPPKRDATDLQSAPFDRSGNLP